MADINPNIAMGYQPIQLENPVNQFAKMQELQMGAAKMQEYQRGLEEQNALRRRIQQPGFDITNAEHQNQLYAEAPSLAPKYIESALLTKKTTGEIDKTTLENHRARVADLAFNPSNENVLAHLQDAVLRKSITPDQAKAQWEQVGAMDMGQRKQYFTQMGLSADKRLEALKPVAVGPKSALVEPGTGKVIFRNNAAASDTGEIPKLKPGEKWNAELQRVEAVPGSEIYNKTSAKHAKDFDAAKTAEEKSDWAIKKIDTILDPKNKSGFESNFGGYNAYITRRFSGNTAKVRNEIESLKSDLKSAGLDIIRKGGSIGAMTEREWPIVEGMLAAITPDLDEKDARQKLMEVKTKFENIKANTRDTYDTTWGETQFHRSGAAGAAKKSSTSGSSGVDTNNPLLK